MEKEIWKDVTGYEGLYQVSNLGKIISGLPSRVIFRKFSKNNKGYLRVVFRKNYIAKTFSVHRLVAEAFIPNPENKLQVNHKNADKSDNRVTNLEWNTNAENMNHAISMGLGTMPIPICMVLVKENFITNFFSFRDAERKTSINRSKIKKLIETGEVYKGIKFTTMR